MNDERTSLATIEDLGRPLPAGDLEETPESYAVLAPSPPCRCEDCDMGWVERKFANARVDRAGETLIDETATPAALAEAYAVVGNYRASHYYPLHSMYMNLKLKAKSVDPKRTLAQRRKRLPSIVLKLKRPERMRLSQMQDIGGARAIVADAGMVDRLVDLFAKARMQNWTLPPKIDNYIAKPKKDGYRSVHLVFKYKSTTPKFENYNGLRIEVQLRTKLQHAWATAAETVTTFTGPLKGEWKRFFALTGSAIADLEERPPVPGVPAGMELLQEIHALKKALDVEEVLSGWGMAVQHLVGELKKAKTADLYLLTLDPVNRRLTVRGYPKRDAARADEEYLQEETRITGSRKQAVLVAVDSVKALRAAYPNFFLDTSFFVHILNERILGKLKLIARLRRIEYE